MNKKLTARILSLALCATLGSTSFAACGGGTSEEQIDASKSQLYVNTFYAGLGDQWLKDFKTAFETKYAETSFEDGKKGVQVVIDYSYSSGYEIVQGLMDSRSEVIWCENVNYSQLATSGLALNINDVVQKPMSEFGETGTIEQKFDDSLLAYYKAVDGNVYALPWFDYMKGVIYDVDIFEGKQSDGYGFYLAKDGGYTSGLEGEPEKANGPDGVAGTFDDGLPVTHEQFFAMMDEMVRYGITPFCFPGMYTYVDSFFLNLWANEAGVEQMNVAFNLSGTAKNLVDVSADGTVTPLGDTEITNENGHLVLKQESKYRAYQFLQKFVKNNRYYSINSFSASQSHVMAEEEFLYNVADGNEKVAMTVNGIWWEEEASSIFTAMSDLDEAYSRDNRRLAWMPMPYYTDPGETTVARKQTVSTETQNCVFIKSNIAEEKVELAKKFLEFTSSDEQLVAFAEAISVPRALKLEDAALLEESDNLTYYGKSVLDMKNNTNIVCPQSTNKFQWSAGLSYHNMFTQAIVGGSTYTAVTFAFYNNTAMTAADYFNGSYNRVANTWQNLLDKWTGN